MNPVEMLLLHDIVLPCDLSFCVLFFYYDTLKIFSLTCDSGLCCLLKRECVSTAVNI